MNIAEIDPVWRDLIAPAYLRRLDDVPFLVRCRAGTVGRSELQHFVRQHYHYSRHFTRYLAALMANLEREEDRRALASNLFEELGLSGEAEIPHAQLYRDMMAAMEISPDDEAPSSETTELVRTMYECCRSRSPMVGLGALCLGGEAIVPHLYSTVLAGFSSVREPLARLRFFVVHVEEDDAHAETMRRIIQAELGRQPLGRLDLEYGATRAIAAREGFLRAIGARGGAPS